ncbi:MAG: tetratricopeptide repeat protein [Methanobacteriota archaeon]
MRSSAKRKNPDALFNKGRALHNSNKFNAALTCYDNVIRIDPEHSKTWRWKGFALRSLERFEEASRCFDKEIELEPDGDYTWYIWHNKGQMVL